MTFNFGNMVKVIRIMKKLTFQIFQMTNYMPKRLPMTNRDCKNI